jgi:hypothetical protein
MRSQSLDSRTEETPPTLISGLLGDVDGQLSLAELFKRFLIVLTAFEAKSAELLTAGELTEGVVFKSQVAKY